MLSVLSLWETYLLFYFLATQKDVFLLTHIHTHPFSNTFFTVSLSLSLTLSIYLLGMPYFNSSYITHLSFFCSLSYIIFLLGILNFNFSYTIPLSFSYRTSLSLFYYLSLSNIIYVLGIGTIFQLLLYHRLSCSHPSTTNFSLPPPSVYTQWNSFSLSLSYGYIHTYSHL